MAHKSMISKHTWQDVRDDVLKVNPALVGAIDELSPGKDLPLYRVRYPYGADILSNGVLNLPTSDGKFVPITSPEIPQQLKDEFAYTANMPIGIVLKNSIELYVNANGFPLSWRVMFPGRIFSLWAMLQQAGTSSHTGKMWHITSGARSLFILPKISLTGGYRKVKKEFGINAAMPSNMFDQWPLFKELANSKSSDADWHSELIFFPKAWFDRIKEPSWMKFELYLLRSAWAETSFMRDQVVFDFAFSMALKEKNLRPNPYLTDTVKHLYMIARGTQSGFKIALDDTVGPVKFFQDVFDKIYGLDFIPTFIYPGFVDDNVVYYSLEIPTLIAFSPKSRKIANKINELREIKHIQTVTSTFILEDQLGLADTPIYKIVEGSNFDYFHSHEDMFDEVSKSSKLEVLDKSIAIQQEQYTDKFFCYTSPFLRGCVAIKRKNRGEL